jgi:hypothetical protein
LSHSRPRGSFWPTRTQRALLEIVLGPVDKASERWEALQPLDIAALETGSFGLLPLLYERLRDVVPDEAQLPRLFGTYRSIWYRNQLLLDRLAVLLPLLRQRAAIEPLFVGGVSALLRWYPQLGLRPVPQLELIVEAEVAEEAVKVSTYAGWRPSGRTRSATILRDSAGRALVVNHGVPQEVVGPLGVGGSSALRERAVALDGVDETPLVLEATDELLYACAFGMRRLPVQTCQWLVDIHRILHSTEGPTPDLLLERARGARLVPHFRATLDYLAAVAGSEVIQEYAATFAAEPVGGRDRIAFALAGTGGSRRAGAAQVLALYLRATANEPVLRAIVHLPRHLQKRWGAPSLASVPLVALRKTLRLLDPQTKPPASERNRSASS